jgi:hypothetical protein
LQLRNTASPSEAPSFVGYCGGRCPTICYELWVVQKPMHVLIVWRVAAPVLQARASRRKSVLLTEIIRATCVLGRTGADRGLLLLSGRRLDASGGKPEGSRILVAMRSSRIW